MTVARYGVTGLSCQHCVHAVTEELQGLPGVTGVEISLVAAGTSMILVESHAPLSSADLSAALTAAGSYRLTEQ